MATMPCTSCGHENRATARFCEACGAPLAPVCPRCGAQARPGARFCDACGQRLPEATAAPGGTGAGSAPATREGRDARAYTPPHLAEKILRGRAALEGERRTVTVLFCDFRNSTTLAERLGPEGMHALLRRFFELALSEVHRLEGTVNQFLGDGLMALFGAPIAHEDSARRAVLAALAIQRRLGELSVADASPDGGATSEAAPRIELRVGLNTGPVVVGSIGDDLRMDYSAVGDTTIVAARMEQLAAPNTIYLSESTHQVVRDYFEYEPCGPLEAKGRPLRAYRVLREKPGRTRIEVAAEHGLTAFVGREHELAVLRGYFQRARGGDGQVVFVSGEAGIGKSRLLLELRRALGDQASQWLEGRCSSFGRSIPYLPIAEMVRRAFGVVEADAPEDIVRRVDEGLGRWDEPARAAAPYLKLLLNVDPGDPAVAAMVPQERRAGLFDALRALLLQESRHGPVVAVVEDLHWIDEQSEAALAALVDAVAAAPVLLLLTYRPGYAPSLGERTSSSRLALGHLPPAAGAALAGAALHATTLPPPLGDLVTRKAGGNPFFIEEVVKALVETGAVRQSNGTYTLERPPEQVRVPATIQEIILSRIDRLERPAKVALQLASVVGREFTLRLLERVAAAEARPAGLEEALGELKGLELISQKSYSPELAYLFKHALTHEVALSTLLRARRVALHRTVGAAVEELYADRLPEHYELLAHHHYEGEAWDKALTYLVEAGDKAAAAFANREAVHFYGRAIEVCERLGAAALPENAAVAPKRGFTLMLLGDMPGALAEFGRMLDAARTLEDRRLEGMALVWRGWYELGMHDFDASEATLREALAIADGGFDDVRLAASAVLGEVLQTINRHAEARRLLKTARELAERVPDPFWRGAVGLYAFLSPQWAGRFDEALRVLDRWRGADLGSVPSWVVLGHRWGEALARGGKGDYQAALTLLQDLIARCERIGDVFVTARALNTIGWVYSELQNHRPALEWNRRSLEIAQHHPAPDPEIESNARLNLGDALLALDRPDEAEAHFRWVERIVRHPRPQDRWMLWRYAQHLFHSYGELWLARGDPDRALAYADECLRLAEASDSRKNVVKARRLRGQALLAQGKPAEAEPELVAALALAEGVCNPPQLWRSHAALGDLRRAQGRPDDAREAYRDALSVVERVAAGLADEALRERLLDSPHVQGIRQAAVASP
jgi:class 3 adenylate cyclase/tetratricopeptide (TPR) repeat protein